MTSSRRRGYRGVVTRIAILPLILVLISFVTFSFTHLAPGSTESTLLGSRPASPEAIAALRAAYNLDDPFLVQYGRWLSDAVRLDFGDSIRSRQPVTSVIGRRMAVTAFLGVYAFVITVVAGVALGTLAALRQRTWLDRLVVTLSVIGISAPAFATGIVLLYLFAVFWSVFPVFGLGDGFFGRLWHMTLPAIALSLTSMALMLKLTRTAMIDVLKQDYITFARGRGVSHHLVVIRHALRNALVPIITAGGLILGYMLSGTVLIEITFALPGLGSLLVESVQFKDIPVLQGLVLTIATMIVAVNLGVDLLYRWIDPRIRSGVER